MGVGGGQQVGGQHRARDGAGAGHHHLLRVPGGEEGAGPQLADDLVAELGADEDVARAGDGDPHPHHALPQLPGPAARRPAQLGPLLGHSPPTGQTPAANMVILIPSAGSGLG